ncbi:2',3'-cyclic-nucleotide 3'-phosphodiesterase [Hoplias malabaricus]|uniref:2',3'-cyclic-nucleotide 3'-phosphodiesterase n=1 Tax=Hoplias malabaricus TaxID=27720 RepID=UPI003461EB35
MDADHSQEVEQTAVESQATEESSPPDQPKAEEVNETPAQDAPEHAEPHVEVSEPEKAPEVEPAEAKSSPEVVEEPVKVAETVEAAAVSGTEEKASEVEKPPQNEVEQKPEATEEPAAKSEQKADSEDGGKTEAAVPAKEAESEKKADAPTTEQELEKPSEAEEVQAELPKEEAQQPKEQLPMFFGWFLLSEVEERIKCSTMDFLKTLDTLEAFKKHLSEFTGEADKEVDLEQYFQTKAPLHCTTKFCDYGKIEGSKEYAEQQVVKDAYGNSAELSVVGLMVTPRTFGARVELTQEQLQLWPSGADKECVPEASLPAVETLPVGSRAHVTLGCAAGVEAAQTGLDLMKILALMKAGQEAVAVEELELGTLSYLGQGRWYLTLREAVTCDTTFSSFSEDKRPTEPPKKEGTEKKKKPKCSIL